MRDTIRKVAILGGRRIPFARSGTDFKNHRNIDLLLPTIGAIVTDLGLQGQKLDEVAIGAVMKHSGDFNLARETVLASPLDNRTPAFDIQRACGTSLETTIAIANKIAMGQIEVGLAAGADTNSDVPLELNADFSRKLVQSTRAKGAADLVNIWKNIKLRELKPKIPQVAEPTTGLSMGEHCELMAQDWGILREDQDHVAYLSHKNACEAYETGWFKDLVIPFAGLDRDNNLRPDASVERLAKLRPAFERSAKGTLTAGNSTPLTDGASCVLLASEDWAKSKGIPVLAYIVHSQSAAVDFVAGDGLLMAPTVAVANILQHLDLKLGDFDFYEIHEAFAAQLLCTLAAWESKEYCQKILGMEAPVGKVDRERLNVRGGSVGIGHPFAATGTRLVATLAKLLSEKGTGRGLLSACTAGGMGVAMVLEA